MNKYNLKFKTYLNDLGAKKPSPGGGSAVCLSVCLGINLIKKAIVYSMDKKPVSEKVLKQLADMHLRAYDGIDLDAELFARVMRTSGKERTKALGECEKLITDIARISISANNTALKLENKIKKCIISDLFIGRDFLRLALKGCVMNLEANSRMFNKENRNLKKIRDALTKWERC
ncbi:MAG: cyclodeaminase/cyclohydrolase family protein [Candidatus Omnitrophica bacterium]|nr:cyclodeaminase/cyclohydrolase family protein [Candidatus Omnitrophota bacterium]MDD5081532.1 cyclodeaminase/cyclohydrolase family protein [Candidatus Omnitrophota bacterium]MDD5440961.1 cyclodeaminase/cyclohydrolase family protein [Candidatus Omnitrophota bacterium]